MIIQKQYKFYAAHRNEQLVDKCRNLHGHRYGLTCHFVVERTGAISTLFSDFDRKVEPFLKQHYDHAMLINVHDPLYDTLCDHERRTGETLRMKRFEVPTSVENLAFQLFGEITELGFQLSHLELRETDSSVITYTHADWKNDQQNYMAAAARGLSGDPLAPPLVADASLES